MRLFGRKRRNSEEHDPPISWRERLRDREFYVQRLMCITPGEEELWRAQPVSASAFRDGARVEASD